MPQIVCGSLRQHVKIASYQIQIQLGWTSLTESGPGDGTIRVLPLLKEPLTHILMRSLLDDIDGDQILGHQPGKLQFLDHHYQQNRLYVERAKWCFMSGDSPPDFHTNPQANSERDFVGRATVKDLNADAKKMMGWN